MLMCVGSWQDNINNSKFDWNKWQRYLCVVVCLGGSSCDLTFRIVDVYSTSFFNWFSLSNKFHFRKFQKYMNPKNASKIAVNHDKLIQICFQNKKKGSTLFEIAMEKHKDNKKMAFDMIFMKIRWTIQFAFKAIHCMQNESVMSNKRKVNNTTILMLLLAIILWIYRYAKNRFGQSQMCKCIKSSPMDAQYVHRILHPNFVCWCNHCLLIIKPSFGCSFYL